jgi:hypothetical protein
VDPRAVLLDIVEVLAEPRRGLEVELVTVVRIPPS